MMSKVESLAAPAEMLQPRRTGKPVNRQEAGMPSLYEGYPYVTIRARVKREDLDRLESQGLEITNVATPPDEPPHPDFPEPINKGCDVDPHLVSYVQNLASQPGHLDPDYTTSYNDALVTGLEPKDPLQLMAASLLVELHHNALRWMAKADAGESMPGVLELSHPERRKAWEALERIRLQWASRAATATASFTKLAETLAKLKGKVANQTMRVEHVHVADGAQAVIGNVGKGGANE